MSQAVKDLREMITLYEQNNAIPPRIWKEVCDENDKMRALLSGYVLGRWPKGKDGNPISLYEATRRGRKLLGEA